MVHCLFIPELVTQTNDTCSFHSSYLLTSASCSSLYLMATVQVRCHGCDRGFTPCGLSQHVSRTQDSRCHGVGVPSQAQWTPGFILQTASPPVLSLIHTPDDLDDDGPGNDPSVQSLVDNMMAVDMDEMHGTFTTMCEAEYLTIFYPTDNNTIAHNGDQDERLDPADAMDPDAFEELTQGNQIIRARNQLAIDEDPEVLDTPIQPTNQTNPGNNMGNWDTTSTMFFDQFPVGNA